MREFKVQNLDRLEVTDGEVRILANSGDLALIFPRAIWEGMLAEASSPSGPTSEELEELATLKRRLKSTPGRTTSPPCSRRCRTAARTRTSSSTSCSGRRGCSR